MIKKLVDEIINLKIKIHRKKLKFFNKFKELFYVGLYINTNTVYKFNIVFETF